MSEGTNRTLVLGASPNPARYSYVACDRLVAHGHEVVAVGVRSGKAGPVDIELPGEPLEHIDTITLYLNPKRQEPYYDYILATHPRRIIFNPGTENPELSKLAREAGIETENACTLVLLATGAY